MIYRRAVNFILIDLNKDTNTFRNTSMYIYLIAISISYGDKLKV